MPLYEYHCKTCGKNFEMQHKMADAAPTHAPDCSANTCLIERQMSRVAAVVKSPNPFAKASAYLQNQTPENTNSVAKPEQKTHQCGSGCALHSH